MNRMLWVVLTVCIFSFQTAHAEKRGSGYMRGGLGFLLGDGNSFINGGQAALNRGFGVGAQYDKVENGSSQSLSTSFLWSNGKVGFGAMGTRTGTKFTSAESTDSVAAEFGFAFAQDRLTMGATYARNIDTPQTSSGVIAGQLNYNSGKGTGFVMGAEYSTTLDQDNGDTKAGTAAMGWQFGPMSHIEVDFTADDLNNMSNNYTLSGVAQIGNGKVYAAGMYSYIKSGVDNPNSASGRVGAVLGSFDVYAEISKVLVTGTPYTYGGALRLVF